MAKWRKGTSGNPAGRQTEKVITDQIKLALNEYHEAEDAEGKKQKIKKIRLLAESIVDSAINGSAKHAEIVLSRIEGSVPNELTIKRSPLDDADAGTLAALQDALQQIAHERDQGAADGDDGETVH